MEKSVKDIELSVRKILLEEGLYSPILDNAITDFAQVTFLKNRAFSDAEKKKAVLTEKSREKHVRYRINPAYQIYLDLVRESQRILSELCMTARTSNTADGDSIDELQKMVREAADE